MNWRTIALTPARYAAICSAVIGLLPACSSIPPPPQIVQVPVGISCVKTVPLKPVVHTDAQLAAADDFKFVLAVFQDRRLLLDYTAELEAILNACK